MFLLEANQAGLSSVGSFLSRQQTGKGEKTFQQRAAVLKSCHSRLGFSYSSPVDNKCGPRKCQCEGTSPLVKSKTKSRKQDSAFRIKLLTNILLLKLPWKSQTSKLFCNKKNVQCSKMYAVKQWVVSWQGNCELGCCAWEQLSRHVVSVVTQIYRPEVVTEGC